MPCSFNYIDIDVWVEPTVVITASNETICNNTATNILPASLQTTTNGIRYTWTVADNPNILGESGSVGKGQTLGTAITQTLQNTSNTAQKVTYRITPHAIDNSDNNACSFNYIDIDVWVEPTVVITASNETICNNTATNILPASLQTTTNGIRYTWTVADNPNILGESGSVGKGQTLGTAITQTLQNTSNTAQKVTYRITPHAIDNSDNNACSFNYIDIDVWVEPTVVITASNETICNNTATNILPASLQTTTNGIRYTWTVADNPNILGESGSVGKGQTLGTAITQTLQNTSNTAQKVTYRITPHAIDNSDNNACSFNYIDIDVWVEPTVVITASNETICNNTATNILPASLQTTTNGIRYTWTVADNPNILGESGSVGKGQTLGTAITQTLQNTSNTAQKVTYRITPHAIDNSDNNACSFNYIDIDVWVEPTVVITASNETICNNTATNILPASLQTTTNGIRYTWTVADNPNILGESGSVGKGQTLGTAITQTLQNTSNTAQKVTYRITPHAIDNSDNNACSFNYIDIDVWVEPTVVITASNETICNNTATNILPASLQTTTNGIRYTWTVADNPNILGESGSVGKGQTLGTAITQTLQNTSNTAQKVTYRITPHAIDNSDNNAMFV